MLANHQLDGQFAWVIDWWSLGNIDVCLWRTKLANPEVAAHIAAVVGALAPVTDYFGRGLRLPGQLGAGGGLRRALVLCGRGPVAPNGATPPWTDGSFTFSRRASPSIGKAALGPPARGYPTACGTRPCAPPGTGSTRRWGPMRICRPAGSGEEVAANREAMDDTGDRSTEESAAAGMNEAEDEVIIHSYTSCALPKS